MRIVISALLVSLTIAGIFFVYQTIPKVKVYADCYRETNQLYNQEGSLTRPAHYTQIQICELNKPNIISAARCFQSADEIVQTTDSSRELIKSIAQKIARNTKTIEEVIADHNLECRERRTGIDPIRDIREVR